MPRNLLGSGVGSWQQETKFGVEREGKNGTEKNWVCVWQGGRQAIQPSPGTGQRWDPGQAVRRVFSSSRGEMKAERRERGQRSGKAAHVGRQEPLRAWKAWEEVGPNPLFCSCEAWPTEGEVWAAPRGSERAVLGQRPWGTIWLPRRARGLGRTQHPRARPLGAFNVATRVGGWTRSLRVPQGSTGSCGRQSTLNTHSSPIAPAPPGPVGDTQRKTGT